MADGGLLRRLLSQGLAPRPLAWTVALGATLGIVPSPWGSGLLCLLAATLLRLNQVVIQAANVLAWPAQLLLVLPLARLGGLLFPGANAPTADLFLPVRGPSVGEVLPRFAGIWFRALGAWALLSPVTVCILYTLVYFVVRRLGLGEGQVLPEIPPRIPGRFR